jgi:hypothetical protein
MATDHLPLLEPLADLECDVWVPRGKLNDLLATGGHGAKKWETLHLEGSETGERFDVTRLYQDPLRCEFMPVRPRLNDYHGGGEGNEFVYKINLKFHRPADSPVSPEQAAKELWAKYIETGKWQLATG